jgi:hypothetical protein
MSVTVLQDRDTTCSQLFQHWFMCDAPALTFCQGIKIVAMQPQAAVHSQQAQHMNRGRTSLGFQAWSFGIMTYNIGIPMDAGPTWGAKGKMDELLMELKLFCKTAHEIDILLLQDLPAHSSAVEISPAVSLT